MVVNPRHNRLLPRVRDALLSRRTAWLGDGLRLSGSGYPRERRPPPAARDPNPDEPAPYRDRRLRGSYRVRAGAPLGAGNRRVPPLRCGLARSGSRSRGSPFPAILSLPVFWIEGLCTAPPDTVARKPARLVDEPGYARRECDSYLSLPRLALVIRAMERTGAV